MRFRRKSWKTMLGITKAKRRTKKALGVYEVTKYTNAGSNAKRRVKRKLGNESGGMKWFRFLKRIFKKSS